LLANRHLLDCGFDYGGEMIEQSEEANMAIENESTIIYLFERKCKACFKMCDLSRFKQNKKYIHLFLSLLES
jgi:hypothetical protein